MLARYRVVDVQHGQGIATGVFGAGGAFFSLSFLYSQPSILNHAIYSMKNVENIDRTESANKWLWQNSYYNGAT
jgi:hypothetical protein